MIRSSLIALFVIIISEFLSKFLSTNSIILSSALFCILFGLIIGNFFNFSNLDNLCKLLINYALKIGVALIGVRLSVHELYEYGSTSLFIIIINIFVVLFVTFFLGKFLKIEKTLSILLSIGSAICGISAIMAASAVIKNSQKEISLAVITITFIGMISVIIYPFLSNYIFETEIIKGGIFLGAIIHDTSQVTAAGTVYQDITQSNEAFNAAITTKLLRNSFLIILIPFLSLYFSYKNFDKTKIKVLNLLPPFLIFFLIFVILRSIGDAYQWNEYYSQIWNTSIDVISNISKNLILLALFALGYSLKLEEIKLQNLKLIFIASLISLSLFASTVLYLKII